MHPQQLFKNVHIAQGVTPENLSPQEVNNGALSPKPQTSPAGDGSGGGLHSTVPEEKLKQSLKMQTGIWHQLDWDKNLRTREVLSREFAAFTAKL